ELTAEADQVELSGLVARDRTAEDPCALRLDQGAGAISQQSAVAPMRVNRVRSVKAALLAGADQPRDWIMAAREDEIPSHVVPGLLARAVPLDARHSNKRKAQA